MPNGVYPVPKSDPNFNPLLGLRVRMRREDLDDQLASGASPATSPELTLRSAQLLRDRAKIAAWLERTVDSARRPAPVLTARVPVRRREVLDCADEIHALAERLREDGPIDVRGVAMTSRLLLDGASPVYLADGVSLRYAVRSARLALDPIGEAFGDIAAAA